MTDYERVYRDNLNACGAPVPEFASFFASAEGALSVLDLGCGQGRDALAAARHGHAVHGVDVSKTGVLQLKEGARAEGLNVTTEVADVRRYRTRRKFDVVVLDRVLHMLASDEERLAVLRKAVRLLRPTGHILLADTRRHRSLIREFFGGPEWKPTLRRGDLLIVHRLL